MSSTEALVKKTKIALDIEAVQQLGTGHILLDGSAHADRDIEICQNQRGVEEDPRLCTGSFTSSLGNSEEKWLSEALREKVLLLRKHLNMSLRRRLCRVPSVCN